MRKVGNGRKGFLVELRTRWGSGTHASHTVSGLATGESAPPAGDDTAAMMPARRDDDAPAPFPEGSKPGREWIPVGAAVKPTAGTDEGAVSEAAGTAARWAPSESSNVVAASLAYEPVAQRPDAGDGRSRSAGRGRKMWRRG